MPARNFGHSSDFICELLNRDISKFSVNYAQNNTTIEEQCMEYVSRGLALANKPGQKLLSLVFKQIISTLIDQEIVKLTNLKFG